VEGRQRIAQVDGIGARLRGSADTGVAPGAAAEVEGRQHVGRRAPLSSLRNDDSAWRSAISAFSGRSGSGLASYTADDIQAVDGKQSCSIIRA
jgi:hypothetical protein